MVESFEKVGGGSGRTTVRTGVEALGAGPRKRELTEVKIEREGLDRVGLVLSCSQRIFGRSPRRANRPLKRGREWMRLNPHPPIQTPLPGPVFGPTRLFEEFPFPLSGREFSGVLPGNQFFQRVQGVNHLKQHRCVDHVFPPVLSVSHPVPASFPLALDPG